jgi:hypothetical protein
LILSSSSSLSSWSLTIKSREIHLNASGSFYWINRKMSFFMKWKLIHMRGVEKGGNKIKWNEKGFIYLCVAHKRKVKNRKIKIFTLLRSWILYTVTINSIPYFAGWNLRLDKFHREKFLGSMLISCFLHLLLSLGCCSIKRINIKLWSNIMLYHCDDDEREKKIVYTAERSIKSLSYKNVILSSLT